MLDQFSDHALQELGVLSPEGCDVVLLFIENHKTENRGYADNYVLNDDLLLILCDYPEYYDRNDYNFVYLLALTAISVLMRHNSNIT